LIQTKSRFPEHLETGLESHIDKPTRIWEAALILGDLEKYIMAEEWHRKAIEGYEIAFGEEHSRTLNGQYGLTPLSWAARNRYNAVINFLLAKDSVYPEFKDSQYGQTPPSWAAAGGHEAVVELLQSTLNSFSFCELRSSYVGTRSWKTSNFCN
jgi:hypothetical protein